MAFIDSKEEWLARLREFWILSTISCDQAYFKIGVAESDWWGGNDHSALGNVIYSIFDLIDAAGYMNDFYDEVDRKSSLIEFLAKHCIVSWESIVMAWVENDFEGRDWTIATIDKMRQILWDEPFDVLWSANIGKQGEP